MAAEDRPSGGYPRLDAPPSWAPLPLPSMAPGEWHTLAEVAADARFDAGPASACPLFHPALLMQVWVSRRSGRLFFRAKSADASDDYWCWIGEWMPPTTPARRLRNLSRKTKAILAAEIVERGDSAEAGA